MSTANCETATLSIAPTLCQRIDCPTGQREKPLSKHLERGIRDEPLWRKMRRKDAIGRRELTQFPLLLRRLRHVPLRLVSPSPSWQSSSPRIFPWPYPHR